MYTAKAYLLKQHHTLAGASSRRIKVHGRLGREVFAKQQAVRVLRLRARCE